MAQPPLQRVAPTYPPLQRKIKLGIQKNGYPDHAGLRSNAEYVRVFHWNALQRTNYRGSVTTQAKAHYSPHNANYLRCLYVATHPENGSFFNSYDTYAINSATYREHTARASTETIGRAHLVSEAGENSERENLARAFSEGIRREKTAG
jgi:hypothetical protein